MKIFVVLLVLCVAEIYCGLVSNAIGRRYNKQGLFDKVVQSVENGPILVVDALGNIISHYSREEDENVRNGLPISIDKVCQVEDDPNKCLYM